MNHDDVERISMKKILSLLLLGTMLLSVASCSQSKPKAPTTSTTGVQKEPEPSDDTVLISEGYAQLDLSKYVKAPALSEIKLSLAELEEKYNYEIKLILQNNATYTDAEEGYAAANGDKVNIHYKGYAANESDNISESTLNNMTNMRYDSEDKLMAGDDLVLGSGSFIGAYESEEHPEKNHPGFEDQLIGMKAGETRTIIVTFPDSYGNGPELQGVEVKFDVTVNSIKKGSTPELTDEMVATYTQMEYKTIADFRAYVLEVYKSSMAYEAFANAVEFITHPVELLDKEITASIYEYIEQIYGNEKLTDAEIKKIFDEQYEAASKNAKIAVEEKLVLEYLCRQLGVELTYGEYKKLRGDDFQKYATYYYYYFGITSEAQVEEYFGREQLVLQFKHEMVLKLLTEKVVFE
jgi:FKBP-type peptidyl-prolyl cis-trans isomerase (trigger factor)